MAAIIQALQPKSLNVPKKESESKRVEEWDAEVYYHVNVSSVHVLCWNRLKTKIVKEVSVSL